MIAATFLLALVAAGPESVPNPRAHKGWVSDVADVIPAEAEASLEAELSALERDLGVEVAVVTLQDVDTTPKDFATRLFHHWGIGKEETNNGLLVLLVMSQRRLEMETGYGLEATLPDGWLGSMQARTMVPEFKKGDFGRGLVLGLSEIDARLRDNGAVAKAGSPIARPARVATTNQHSPGPAAIPLMLGFALAATALILVGVWLRRRVSHRYCKPCKQKMLLLDEVADDAHLDSGQRTEEQLGSVDYLVFICAGCQATSIIRKQMRLAQYWQCAACSYQTLQAWSKTITLATYEHGGVVEIEEQCHHCGHKDRYQRMTAPRTHEAVLATSSFSSGVDMSSSSFGGGSFGGGDSGGGGAGSSW